MIGWMLVEAGERSCPLSTLVDRSVALSITPAHSTAHGSPADRRPPLWISHRSGGGILSGSAFFFFSLLGSGPTGSLMVLYHSIVFGFALPFFATSHEWYTREV